VANEVWYPLDAGSMGEVSAFLKTHGLAINGAISLRAYLDLQRGASSLLYQETDEASALNALAFASPEGAKPNGIEATLYPYQVDGWHWLRFLVSERLGGILGDEMGLGKTLQVISAIADPAHKLASPVLVVAPGSILENWIRELRKFAPRISAVKHHGAVRT